MHSDDSGNCRRRAGGSCLQPVWHRAEFEAESAEITDIRAGQCGLRPRLLSADLAWVTNGVDGQRRALEWRDLFASVEFTNGDIRHDIELFRNGGPAEPMQARLSALEASLIDRKNSVRDIALVVDFADRLRGEISKVEESDVTSGTRKPGLFARMRA